MDDIFEIKFLIESEIKDKVIQKFSNKQGGPYNIFSYYWQCFVWAATIGFLRNERRELSPGTERIFSLNTMKSNGGEKDAQALICMCIARTGSVDIMKDPSEAIKVISEYANGGFYHILKLMENGENTFNDFEKVKQEIFSRDYWARGLNAQSENKTESSNDSQELEEPTVHIKDNLSENVIMPKVRKRWTVSECSELNNYFKQGMTIEQLASFFSKSEDSVRSELERQGLI